MRKLAIGTAVLVSMAMLASPALAQSSSSSVSSGTTSSADRACLSTAVDTRMDATITARTTMNTSVMNALTKLRTDLHAAYLISNDHDRQVAITAAWTAYVDATKAARTKYKADIKVAADAYSTAKANCHVATSSSSMSSTSSTSSMSSSHHGDDEDKDNDHEGKHDNGLHLGQIKHGMTVKTDVKTHDDFWGHFGF